MEIELRTIVIGMLISLFASAANAGNHVTYAVKGVNYEGYHATATGTSKGLVLIIHDWDGLTNYEVKRADMLANMGYDAFAVDLYGKGNRPVETKAKKAETRKLYKDREKLWALILAGSLHPWNDRHDCAIGHSSSLRETVTIRDCTPW